MILLTSIIFWLKPKIDTFIFHRNNSIANKHRLFSLLISKIYIRVIYFHIYYSKSVPANNGRVWWVLCKHFETISWKMKADIQVTAKNQTLKVSINIAKKWKIASGWRQFIIIYIIKQTIVFKYAYYRPYYKARLVKWFKTS